MGAHEKNARSFIFSQKIFAKKTPALSFGHSQVSAKASIVESLSRAARGHSQADMAAKKKAALKNISDAHFNVRRLSRTNFMREIAPNKCAG